MILFPVCGGAESRWYLAPLAGCLVRVGRHLCWPTLIIVVLRHDVFLPHLVRSKLPAFPQLGVLAAVGCLLEAGAATLDGEAARVTLRRAVVVAFPLGYVGSKGSGGG